MRFHQPLDNILNNATKVRILRFLCRGGGEWTGRRLASYLSLNPVTAHRALRELYQATVLNFRRVGNSFVYSLRDGHLLVEMLRACFEQEATARQRLSEILQKKLGSVLRRQIITAALYGSTARGDERPTSDLDLLIVVSSAEAKPQVEQALERFYDAIITEFGNSPSFYINTVREVRSKFEKGLPVFENILRDHQILWGKPLKGILHDAAS